MLSKKEKVTARMQDNSKFSVFFFAAIKFNIQSVTASAGCGQSPQTVTSINECLGNFPGYKDYPQGRRSVDGDTLHPNVSK